jgi:CYTH domain-containing protein
MEREVERKLLGKDRGKILEWINSLPKNSIEVYYIDQFYLSIDPKNEIRVRRKENIRNGVVKYFKTIKNGTGLIREENEYEIDETTFNKEKRKSIAFISKKRVAIKLPEVKETIEVDFFKNKDLVIFEIEYEAAPYKMQVVPDIVWKLSTKEITDMEEYKNAKIATRL